MRGTSGRNIGLSLKFAARVPPTRGRFLLSGTECLTENQVLGFLEGRLSKRELTSVDTHLNACTECAALVLEMLQAGSKGRDPRVPAAAPVPAGARCWTFEANTLVADRYLIIRPIAHGGMGEVYEAHDVEVGAAVALKTTLVTQCDEPERACRLMSEYEFARRVAHPQVCRVYDAGLHRDDGADAAELAYLSMELIEGVSLARLLRIGRLVPEQVLAMARQLLSGVSAIHGAGVIHRDIKSSNVMLRNDEPTDLVIVDFGLAIDSGPGNRDLLQGVSASPFSLEGSPAYMAPEQFRDVQITPATDIFACGVVLFEALTGTLPFRTLLPQTRCARRDPREVPLHAAELVRDVPARLDAFIAGCLELDPSRRHASANAALALLERPFHD